MPNIVPFPITAEDILIHDLWLVGNSYCETESHKKYKNSKVFFDDLVAFITKHRGKQWSSAEIDAKRKARSGASLAVFLGNNKDAAYDLKLVSTNVKEELQDKSVAERMGANVGSKQDIITADNLLAFITAYQDFVKYDGKILLFNARDVNLIEELTRVITEWKRNPSKLKTGSDVKRDGGEVADGKTASGPSVPAAAAVATGNASAPSSTPATSSDGTELAALRKEFDRLKGEKEAAELRAKDAEQKLSDANAAHAKQMKEVTERQLDATKASAAATSAVTVALSDVKKTLTENGSTGTSVSRMHEDNTVKIRKAKEYFFRLSTPTRHAIFLKVLELYHKKDEKDNDGANKKALLVLQNLLIEYTCTKGLRSVPTNQIITKWKEEARPSAVLAMAVVPEMDVMPELSSVAEGESILNELRLRLHSTRAVSGFVMPDDELYKKIATANNPNRVVPPNGKVSRSNSFEEAPPLPTAQRSALPPIPASPATAGVAGTAAGLAKPSTHPAAAPPATNELRS